MPCAARLPARLRSARFKSPKFAPWAHLANSTLVPDAATRLLTKCNHEQQHHQDAPKEFLLRCHSCNATNDMLHRTLYQHGRCMHVVCKHCTKGAAAARWICKCGNAWIACPLCRPLGFACRSSRRKRGSASLPTIGTTPIPPPPQKKASHALFCACFCELSGSGQTWA